MTIAALAEPDHTRDMHTAAAPEAPYPIIIYRSVDRAGQTFALHPLSRDRLKECFGDSIHVHPRVFIAHATEDDYHRVHTGLADQIVMLLTGLSRQRLDELGGVSFWDPVSDIELDLDA